MGHSYSCNSIALSKMLGIIVAWSMHRRPGSSAIRTSHDRADDLVGCIELASIIFMFRPLDRWNCPWLAATVTIEGDTCLDSFLCILFTALSTRTYVSAFF